jgi:hypothetical protein
MAYHPVRIDRLDRGSVFLIVSEGQPADEYTVPVGFGHHVEGTSRWTIRIWTDRGNSAPHLRSYDTPGPERGTYFRSWQDVVEYADRCIGGHGADLVQPSAGDIIRWARQAEHDTVIRYDALAVASEAIRKQREQEH